MINTEIEKNPEEVIVPRWNILKILNEHKILWKDWGTTGTTSRTLEDLFKYHERDRLYFRNGSSDSDKLIIDVHAAIVIVTHKTEDGLVELYEDRQVFPDGSQLRRNKFNGIAETAKRSETMREAAERCLEEELKFCNLSLYELSDCIRLEHRDITESEKWPGIWAVYHRYIFECVISSPLFDPDGYIEREKDRTIYFKWKPINQLIFTF